MIGRCVEAAAASGAAEVIVVDDGSIGRKPGRGGSAAGAVLPSSRMAKASPQAVNTGARGAHGGTRS